jgi:hypothetical protein
MQKILVILLLATSYNSYSYVDLNLSYSYTKRKIEGIDPVTGDTDSDYGQAISTSSGYHVNWAWNIWEYTALEFNYSERNEHLVDDREVTDTDSGITIKEVDSLIKTTVQGIGIRQSFANRKSAIVPTISIGYAKLTTSGETKYTLNQLSVDYDITQIRDKEVYNSSYASFSLAFRITQLVRLTLMGKTVMPDFDTAQANNNLTYSAGLSWMF